MKKSLLFLSVCLLLASCKSNSDEQKEFQAAQERAQEEAYFRELERREKEEEEQVLQKQARKAALIKEEQQAILRAQEAERERKRLEELKAKELEMIALEEQRLQRVAEEKYQKILEERQKFVGEKFPKLIFKDGRDYEKVSIIEVNEEGIAISHAYGVRSVKYADLPDALLEEMNYDPNIVDPSLAYSEDSQEKGSGVLTDWTPQSDDDIVKCCLLVIVETGVDEVGRKASWSGSAFIANEGDRSYIYSNVHNFFGAKDFYFQFADGTKITKRELGAVSCSFGDSGFNKLDHKLFGWGGDVIRIALRRYYPQALTIDSTTPLEEMEEKEILITGNSGGRGEITKLKGRITKMAENDIIYHNVATEAGNSGSPIIDLETKKVVGILTWGSYDPGNHVMRIWEKDPNPMKQGINSGAALAKTTFKGSSFERLLEERLTLNEIKKNVRILGLMDALYPSTNGLFINLSARVSGDYSVRDIIQESPNHPIVKKLAKLHAQLEQNKSRSIKMANTAVIRAHLATYKSCLAYSANAQGKMVNYYQNASFFFQCSVNNSLVTRIWGAYHRGLERTNKWYAKQLSATGQALQLSQRYRLPVARSGLRGLGIQGE